MKKFCYILILLLTLLSGCIVVQEVKEGANFEGLKSFYLEKPIGSNYLFSKNGNLEQTDAELSKYIIEYLESIGYKYIDDVSKAEIIFQPQWNQTFKNNDYVDIKPANSSNINSPIGSYSPRKMVVMLEIQAILPNFSSQWAWRGFSPETVSPEMITISNIKRQVKWCLETFPPEKHPNSISFH